MEKLNSAKFQALSKNEMDQAVGGLTWIWQKPLLSTAPCTELYSTENKSLGTYSIKVYGASWLQKTFGSKPVGAYREEEYDAPECA